MGGTSPNETGSLCILKMKQKYKHNPQKGDKFNRWTFIEEVDPRKSNQGVNLRRCMARCECGTIKPILLLSMINGTTKSCGCLNAEINHKAKSLVEGVGVNDYEGLIKDEKSYKQWGSMLRRCYNPKYHQHKPTYIGCTVCEEWKYFSNFKRWFDANYIEGHQLDKDIIVKGNKVYSPQTCCFVPNEINILLNTHKRSRGKYVIGVTLRDGKFAAQISYNGEQRCLGIFDNEKDAFACYKQHKEQYIKEVALDHFNRENISIIVFNALCNYKIEIND